MQDRLRLARETRRSIGHQTLALRRTHFATQIRLSGEAKFAFAAFRNVAWNDVIANFATRHASANGLNDARALNTPLKRNQIGSTPSWPNITG
jgi:hypothetical protein